MLIAEDLLLLLTEDRTGKLVTSAEAVDIALGGAFLVELALLDRLDVAAPGEEVRKGRLVVRDDTPTADPLLDEALAVVVRRAGKRPQSVVTELGKRVRVRLYDRLVDSGVLRVESGRVLGVFPTHRWPALDAAHEDALRLDLEAALRNGLTGDARVAALVSLCVALDVVSKVVVPDTVGLTKKELKANAKRIAEGDWASAAVRKAIDELIAGVAAAVVAATVVASGSQ